MTESPNAYTRSPESAEIEEIITRLNQVSQAINLYNEIEIRPGDDLLEGIRETKAMRAQLTADRQKLPEIRASLAQKLPNLFSSTMHHLSDAREALRKPERLFSMTVLLVALPAFDIEKITLQEAAEKILNQIRLREYLDKNYQRTAAEEELIDASLGLDNAARLTREIEFELRRINRILEALEREYTLSTINPLRAILHRLLDGLGYELTLTTGKSV
jgi:hypothetical protein